MNLTKGRKKTIVVGLIIMITSQVVGQCPSFDFTVPSTSCLNGAIEIQNNSPDAYTYNWDLCDGDLLNPSSGQELSILTNISAPRGLVSVNFGNDVISFTIGENNRFVRIRHVNGLGGTVDVTNFQNIGGLLSTPRGITYVKEGANHYVLIANLGGSLIRVDFGSDLLSSNPVASTMVGVPSVNGVAALKYLEWDSSKILYAIGTGTGGRDITVIDFGASILNATPSSNTMSFAGASSLATMSLLKECNDWYGLLTSFSNSKYYKMFLGSDPRTLSSSEELTGITGPLGTELRWEAGSFYGFISSNAGAIFRINFGASFETAGIVSSTSIGDYGLISQPRAFELISQGSREYGLSIGYSDRRLTLISFSENCGLANPVVAGKKSPIFNYSNDGTYNVTGEAINGSQIKRVSRAVTVNPSIAPDISFTTQNVCANHDINFTSVNSSGNITDYLWDFGDSNTSILENPAHVFTAATDYNISLTVTADNGCTNFVKQTVTTFDEPTADFQMPAPAQFCTNQSYFFQNASNTDPNYTLTTWQWLVNGVEQATTQDLNMSFTQTTNQDITLIASIPGCTNQKTESISSLAEGPVTSFTFTGQCQGEDIFFTNNSSGTISGYSWDFDDGQTSPDENPVHVFSENDTYEVTLTATSPSGCENTFTLPVTAYTKPAVNFLAELPPFSCSGTPTFLKDQTPPPSDSDLSSWSWGFGDPSSGQNSSALKDPTHTYILPGDYNVQLTVETDRGCIGTLQKSITVEQTPIVNFTHSATCKDVASSFMDQTLNAQFWNWSINGVLYSTPNPFHTFTTSGPKNVSLNVTASNGCIASKMETVTVPVPLTPNYSVLKNCVSELTQLTDITTDATDPIVSRKWSFLSTEISSTNPTIEYTFASAGNVTIAMEAQAASGCKYTKSGNVAILNKPFASFTAMPLQGGVPFVVQFSNSSSGATAYNWQFGDASGATSTLTNPSYTYNEEGIYDVLLTARNAQECSSTATQRITANLPFIDAVITQLDFTPTPTGAFYPEITVLNNSNIPISDIRVVITINNEVRLEDVIATTIPVSGLYAYKIPIAVINSEVEFVCVELDLPGDINPLTNRHCASLENDIIVLTPYPNPASTELFIEWIAEVESKIGIRLSNSMGREISYWNVDAAAGLNQMRINTANLAPGLYLVTVDTRVFRVVIGH